MNRTGNATMNTLLQQVADEFVALAVPQEWFIETLPSTKYVLEMAEHSSNCDLCLSYEPCSESDRLERIARWMFAGQLSGSLRN